jgi:hypothetical protein
MEGNVASQPIGMSGGQHRTAAITILAVLAVVAGILNVIDTLRYLGLLPVAEAFGMKFFATNWLGAILAAIVALIWFSVARQLWNLDPRGWMFIVLIACFNMIFLALAVIGSSTVQAVAPAFVISAAALILALLPGTKNAFGRL